MSESTPSADSVLQNEPIEITTPVRGHKVHIKPYTSGRDRMEIRGALLREMKITGEVGHGEEDQRVQFSAAAMNEAYKKRIERLVVDVDGDPNDVLDKVLDMHGDDTQAVIEATEKIYDLSNLNEKKKAS